jgi:hypothetical protein
MPVFIVALYEGATVGTARLVACSCDPAAVEGAARSLLAAGKLADAPESPGVTAANRGKHAALRSLIRRNRTQADRPRRKSRKEGGA